MSFPPRYRWRPRARRGSGPRLRSCGRRARQSQGQAEQLHQHPCGGAPDGVPAASKNHTGNAAPAGPPIPGGRAPTTTPRRRRRRPASPKGRRRRRGPPRRVWPPAPASAEDAHHRRDERAGGDGGHGVRWPTTSDEEVSSPTSSEASRRAPASGVSPGSRRPRGSDLSGVGPQVVGADGEDHPASPTPSKRPTKTPAGVPATTAPAKERSTGRCSRCRRLQRRGGTRPRPPSSPARAKVPAGRSREPGPGGGTSGSGDGGRGMT